MQVLSLTEKTCTPCRGDTPPLRSQEIAQYHPQVPQWAVMEDKKIRRTYRFKDFVTALDFVNKIGAVAEQEGHHPDLYLAWGKVEVLLWTHKIGGLSDNDFILAAKVDALAKTAPGLKAS